MLILSRADLDERVLSLQLFPFTSPVLAPGPEVGLSPVQGDGRKCLAVGERAGHQVDQCLRRWGTKNDWLGDISSPRRE